MPSLHAQIKATLQSAAVEHAPHAPLLHVPTVHGTVEVVGMPPCMAHVSSPEPSLEQWTFPSQALLLPVVDVELDELSAPDNDDVEGVGVGAGDPLELQALATTQRTTRVPRHSIGGTTYHARWRLSPVTASESARRSIRQSTEGAAQPRPQR